MIFMLTRSTPTPPGWGFRGYNVPLALAYGTIGALVASRRSRNPIGWLLLATGGFAAVQALAAEYSVYAVMTKPGSLPAGEIMGWIPHWIWVLVVSPVLLTMLFFPSGQLLSSRWRLFLFLVVLFLALLAVLYAFLPGPMDDFGGIRNPVGIQALQPLSAWIYTINNMVLIATSVGGVVALAVRFRKGGGDERRQLSWLAYAGALLAVTTVINGVEMSVRNTVAQSSGTDDLVVLALLTIPVAMGLAILRYRLYDIDIVINRTLVYGPLTAILAGVYIVATVFFPRIFVTATGQQSEVAIVLTTLTVVALFTPLKKRLQAIVDRYFKEVPDPTKRLRAYREQLRSLLQMVDIEKSLRHLLQEATSAFDAQYASVDVLRDGKSVATYTQGPWDGNSRMSVPVERNGQTLAVLNMGPQRNGRAYLPQDQELLREIASLAGTAIRIPGDGE